MEIANFFIQKTVIGNCDGFKKEKLLKTSRVAGPNIYSTVKRGDGSGI